MTFVDLVTAAVGLIVFGGLMTFVLKQQRRARRPSRERRYARPATVSHSVGTASASLDRSAQQLASVMNAQFAPKPILSITEARVMAAAEAAIAEANLSWRMMAQVALGEILRCEDVEGFRAINAKRVDLLVVGPDRMPLAAIEYQGSGHHLGSDVAARDAIKREALRRAGIAFIEIDSDDGPADVRRAIGKLAFSTTARAARPMRMVEVGPSVTTTP